MSNRKLPILKFKKTEGYYEARNNDIYVLYFPQAKTYKVKNRSATTLYTSLYTLKAVRDHIWKEWDILVTFAGLPEEKKEGRVILWN